MTRQLGQFQLRPYQEEAAQKVASALASHRSCAVVMPTGTGKSVAMAAVAADFHQRTGRQVLILAHLDGLLRNEHAKTLSRAGIPFTCDWGDQRADANGTWPDTPVVLSTRQSQVRRIADRLRAGRPGYGLIHCDECHHCESVQYREILGCLPRAGVVGWSATLDRGDGLGLGGIFETIAYELSLCDALGLGAIVEPEILRVETGVPFGTLRPKGSDYSDAELAERIGPHVNRLAHCAAQHLGTWRRAIVFVPSVKIAEAFAKLLNEIGISASDISGKDSVEEQQRLKGAFAEGRIRVLSSCDLLIEGFDEPSIGAVVLARPTRSRARMAQMIGRGLRTHPPNKTKCLVIDLALATDDHSLVHPAELFDSTELDDDVVTIMRRLIDEGKVRRATQALDMAKKEHAEQQRRKFSVMSEDAARHRLDSNVSRYRPLSLVQLGLITQKAADFGGGDPASEAQLGLLRKFRITVPDRLTKAGASRYIYAFFKRRQNNLASPKMVEVLIRNGTDPHEARRLTRKEASQRLSVILGPRKTVTVRPAGAR